MRFAVEWVRYGGANAAYWMSDRARIMEVCAGMVEWGGRSRLLMHGRTKIRLFLLNLLRHNHDYSNDGSTLILGRVWHKNQQS